MSVVEQIDEFLVGRIAFPATNYLLNRKDILGRYRKLLASERYSTEALRELQFQKLSALLQRAYKWVPFYTRRFQEIGLVPDDIKTLEDIRQIPPLDRQDLIAHRFDLVDSRYRNSALAADKAGRAAGLPISLARLRRHRLVRNTSTGSTGSPTVFYEDGSTTALNWVHEQRLKSWFGLPPGVKEARMKGSSTKYEQGRLLRAIRECFWNQLALPGVYLSDAEYEFCLRKIREFRPRVLWGPTAGLTGLARYIQREGQDLPKNRPELVISWAAPLHAHEKKLLTEVFRCPVTNLYGTREVGHVAMKCLEGTTHVNQENYLVEVERSDPGSAGPGKILITPLLESPMPFLRYRIGDLGELGGTDCACGRSLISLQRILGRVGDVFQTQDGHLVEPAFWCHAFMDGLPSVDVENFQVVYRRSDCIRIRIVPRRSYSAKTEAELLHCIAPSFPAGMKFEFEYVAAILPQPSGKYPLIVNEIEEHEEQPALI